MAGGVADSVMRLSEELHDRGHDVTVYTSSKFTAEELPASTEVVHGVTIRRMLNTTRMQLLYGVVPNIKGIMGKLREDRPDVINLHGVGHLEVDFIARVANRIPLVLTGHGGVVFNHPYRPSYQLAVWNAYEKLILRKTVRHCQKVIALTQAEIPYWLKLESARNKIELIPWAAPEDCYLAHDAEAFRNRYGLSGRVIMFAGRLDPGKGAQHLISAMPRILSLFPDVYAVLSGSNQGQGRDLVKQAQRLGVRGHVLFLEFLPRNELVQAYAACDVFVMPSDFEGFGLAIVEAMASERPVVASRVGAVPFIVDNNQTGLLVPPRSPERLADAIIMLLADSSLARKLGQKARQRVRMNSWGAIAKRYEEIYTELVMPRMKIC